MSKTKEYELVRSDRIQLIDAAVDVVITLKRKRTPAKGDEWKANDLDKLEGEAYTTALRFLIKEFREGPTDITEHLVLDSKD